MYSISTKVIQQSSWSMTKKKTENRTSPYLYHFLQTFFLQNEAKSVKLIAELYLQCKNEAVCHKLASFVKNHKSAKKHYIGRLLSWKLNIFNLVRATSQLALAANVV